MAESCVGVERAQLAESCVGVERAQLAKSCVGVAGVLVLAWVAHVHLEHYPMSLPPQRRPPPPHVSATIPPSEVVGVAVFLWGWPLC